MSNGLFNWSISTLLQYDACPMRVKLKKIDKMPEPPIDPNGPLERGNREHQLFQEYVEGDIVDLSGSTAKALNEFKPYFDHARELYSVQIAHTEEDWLFDSDWNDTTREQGNIWLWAKVDLSIHDQASDRIISVDYKTGKSAYKAIDHIQQNQLYAAISALKFEWANTIDTELWYVDEGLVKSSVYTREQALTYVGRFQQRADKMMSDKFFRPNPNKHTCRYCPYSPRGTGACPVGI